MNFLVGQELPRGDFEELKKLGARWEKAGKDLPAILNDARAAAKTAGAGRSGDAGDSFVKFWNDFSGDDGVLAGTDRSLAGLAESVRGMADQVRATQVMVYGQAVWLAGELAVAWATAGTTF